MEALQFESAAPKSVLVVTVLVVREEMVVVARVDVPSTASVDESDALVPVIDPRLETVA